MHQSVFSMCSFYRTNHAEVMVGDTWSRPKFFNFLQLGARSVSPAAAMLFVSFLHVEVQCTAQAQLLTAASTRLCEICADRSSGNPPTPFTQLPVHTMSHSFELRRRESVHCNVFEIVEEKFKTVRLMWEETKLVNERRLFKSSRQNKCYNSGRLIEQETDSSSATAFSLSCGWSAEMANENFPTIFISHLLISVYMQDHSFFLRNIIAEDVCAAVPEHQLLLLGFVTERDLTHHCRCLQHPPMSLHLIWPPRRMIQNLKS